MVPKDRCLQGRLWFPAVLIVSFLLAGCEGNTRSTTSVAAGAVLATQPASVDSLVILYTGSTQGNFEPCGCGGVSEGGLSRRATVVEKLRERYPHLLLVDTGDLVSRDNAEIQLEYLAQAYHLLGYDAVLPGEVELGLGAEKLQAVARKWKLPLVLSNVKAKQDWSVPESIALTFGDKKIGIIGVIANQFFKRLSANIRDQYIFEPPLDSIRRLTVELRECDAIILLSHLALPERNAMVKEVAGVSVWINTGGHNPRVVHPSGDVSQTQPTTDEAANMSLLESWSKDQKIGQADLNFSRTGPTVVQTKMIEIKKQIPIREKYLEIYDAYLYAVRQTSLAKSSQLRRLNPGEFLYVSAEKCRECHTEQYDWWAKTGHARAFDTLEKHHRADDPNCWACHTTGFHEPTGFDGPERTPELKHVGCQMCHRFDLRMHPENPQAKARTTDTLPVNPRAKLITLPKPYDLTRDWDCRRCHVEHRSPNFNFAKFRERIACPKSTTRPADEDTPSPHGSDR